MKTLFFLFFSFASIAQCATISTQPLPQITCEGDSIRLIAISSSGTFQWEKRRPTDAKFTSITNARTARYHFLSGGATHPTGSFYRLKITVGKCISYSDSVLVVVRKAPAISSVTVCEKTLISFPYSWTLNGQAVDSIIATPTLNGAKIKAFARFSTLPLGSCVLASNEVSLNVTSLPAAPSHAVKLVKACVGLPFSLNATGCSPSLTYWYNSAGVKLGEDSRLPLIGSDSAIFRASCVKSSCEGPLSTGVKTVIYSIPAPPLNTTSAYFCSDTPITLEASGGLNNIWYETESAKTSLSTATSLAMKAISNSSELDTLIIRFASIKINDCESARIPVAIRVKPRLKLRPLLPISLTGERTISPFETLALNGTLPYRILYNSTAKNPLGPFSSSGYLFRTVIDSLGCLAKDTTEVYYVRNGPIIHRLTAQMETNCLTSNYRIRVNGCPLKTSAIAGSKRYESSTADFALSGGQYTFLCNDGESDTLFLNLPILKLPTSLVRKSFTSSICEADSASMSLIVDPSVHFIGWELNGHLFSTEKLLTGLLPAGVYQSVIEENGCYYRSEKIVLERKANPPPPRLEKSGAYFIRAKSTGLLEWLIDQTKLTDTASFRKITEGREFYVRAKWLYKSLSCFSAYSNVFYVDRPATYEFAVYPNPSPGIFSIEIAYETEAAQIQLYDIKGKLIDSTTIKNSSRRMDWDISRFPAGTYVLRLISDGISQEKTIRKSL
ncbi:T9SS type A sorting domain-containing protein [Aquirufa sp. HETE-83D]|uniref:T9SS type A sorting domain-containing protein n=1 Tax=Aquirufa esocilacus TaxID=3096513 RepID=A0ABW6DEY0_9BACT